MPSKSSDSFSSKNSLMERVRQLVTDGRLPPFILVISPDEIRLKRLLDFIFQEAFGKDSANRSMLTRTLDARGLGEAELGALEDSLSSLPLFGASELCVLNHVQELTAANQKRIGSWITERAFANTLILSATSLPPSNILLKLLAAKDALIELPVLEGKGLASWTKLELKRAGIEKFSGELLELLIEHCSKSPDAIYKVAAHLALYADSEEVTIEDFERLFPSAPSVNEFKFVDSLSSNSKVQCEVASSLLWRNDKNPLGLLALVSRNFTQCAEVRALLDQKKSSKDIEKSLNLKPWILNKLIANARKRPQDKLIKNINAVLKADSKLKNRSLGTELVYSELIDSIVE